MTPFSTSREIPATAEQVFAASSDPQRLARWWGPAGFTNTFKVCRFRNGGAHRIEHIVVPANEQNLDRLSAEVLRQ